MGDRVADRVRIMGGLTVGRKTMTTVRGRGGGQGTDNGRADSWPKTNDNCQGTGQRTGYG